MDNYAPDLLGCYGLFVRLVRPNTGMPGCALSSRTVLVTVIFQIRRTE